MVTVDVKDTLVGMGSGATRHCGYKASHTPTPFQAIRRDSGIKLRFSSLLSIGRLTYGYTAQESSTLIDLPLPPLKPLHVQILPFLCIKLYKKLL